MEPIKTTIKIFPFQDRPLLYRLLTDRDATGVKLNLGCGFNHLTGCTNIDNNPDCHPDLVVDLQKFPWPIPTDHAHYVCAVNTLEHLPNLLGFLGELWRICTPEAKVEIIVPNAYHPYGVEDPTHCRFFGPSSWQYFDARTFQENTSWYTPDRFHFILGKYEPVISDQACSTSLENLERLETNRQNSPTLVSLLKTMFFGHTVGVISHHIYRLQAIKPLPPARDVVLNIYE